MNRFDDLGCCGSIAFSHWARGHDGAICDVSQMNGNDTNSTQSRTFSVGLKWKSVHGSEYICLL